MAKKTKVKNYRRAGQMQRDIEKMMNAGWRIESQSGELNNNLMFNTKQITVVWRRD